MVVQPDPTVRPDRTQHAAAILDRLQDGVMLDGRAHRSSASSIEDTQYRQIVGLGTAGGEDDLAGIAGEQVDGNDVVAVRAVIGEAIERARCGGGPTLVEALTYRLADHTTADDASRYRSDEEVSEHWAFEPVARLRNLLVARGEWGRDQEEALLGECAETIDRGVEEYESTPPMPPGAMFDHLYAELPVAYRAQRSEVEKAAS